MDDSGGEKKHMVDVLTETQALFAGFSIGDFFPEWKWLNTVTGLNRRLTKNLEELKTVCNEIIEEHVKEKEGEDFVDVLLRVQKRTDLEVPITDDNLKALVLVSIHKICLYGKKQKTKSLCLSKKTKNLSQYYGLCLECLYFDGIQFNWIELNPNITFGNL